MNLKVGENDSITAAVEPNNATDKTLTWVSSNTAVATVDNNGRVSAVGEGSATITATAKDGSNIKATCEVTVTAAVVKAAEVTLSAPTLSLEVGQSGSLTATVKPDNATDKTVTWTSDNSAVATVDSSGNVTAKGEGTAIITATAKSDSNVKASCTVTVTAAQPADVPVTGVALDQSSISTTMGGSASLSATLSPADATNKNVTWSSSNESVIKVDSNGSITIVGVGNATITVTTEDGGHKATCSISVSEAASSSDPAPQTEP